VALVMSGLWLAVGVASVLATWFLATRHATLKLRRASAALASAAEEMRPVERRSRILNVSEQDSDEVDAGDSANISAVVREALLELRNQELRLILDTVDQGFMTVQPDGMLRPERSAVLATWVDALPERAYIWDLVGKLDPSAQSWMKGAWHQIFMDVLPAEAAIAQLPRNLSRGHQHWELAYHPVRNRGAIDRIVVVLTDVSAEVEGQRAVAEQHDFSALVERFVISRTTFMQSWSEMSGLVQRATSPGARGPDLLRALHTLKGSLRFVGVKGVAALCHTLEDNIGERPESCLKEAEAAQLREAWGTLVARMNPLIRGASGTMELAQGEYERLRDAIDQRAPYQQLARLVRGLLSHSARDRLLEAKDYLVAACRKLGKTPPDVELVDHALRLDPTRFSRLWTVFVHVLNNTADHGIEPDAERLAAGKELPARIKIETTSSAGWLVIEVTDDGPGIDWTALAERARQRGLPHETHEDLVRALFSDSLSLKGSVSQFSGRGVGLAAIAEVVQDLAGEIQVESSGSGTTVRIRVPL
jgi:two-component system, chemotaxis family, sensor kinase CheA